MKNISPAFSSKKKKKRELQTVYYDPGFCCSLISCFILKLCPRVSRVVFSPVTPPVPHPLVSVCVCVCVCMCVCACERACVCAYSLVGSVFSCAPMFFSQSTPVILAVPHFTSWCVLVFGPFVFIYIYFAFVCTLAHF